MSDIQVYNNQLELNEGFTAFILRLLGEKERVSIALSGGSTPKAVFDYWAQLPTGTIPWERICFYWGDERCVSPDDAMSNYGMTRKHLFDHITIPEENIFRIKGENDPEEEAVRYGALLPEVFDLIVLGMGDDGHTASIFPYNIRLWDSEELCVVAAHPESGMLRVSFTGKVINAARNVAFLVTGKNKTEKVDRILRHRTDWVEVYPAARVAPVSGRLVWFLDREAAELKVM